MSDDSQKLLEELVAEYGECRRRFIVAALDCIDRLEALLTFPSPLCRREYVEDEMRKLR